MTIIYQYKVANTSLCGFFKLLGCWKGSVYKLMYKEMLLFSAMYGAVSAAYRFALNQDQRRTFEKVVLYCNSYTSLIPVSFVLGFYISVVVHRWWQQFRNIPWPDRTLFILGSYLQGQDEQCRIYRRTVARYMLFGLILITRSISVAVMKRFPTIEHIIDAGFINPEEALLYERVNCKYNKFWVPIVWANSVLTRARREGKIDTDIGFRLVMEQLADYRDKCSLCFVYDWITIPIVYTQVVTLAVYTFFGACLVGRQYIDPDEGHEGYNYDLYVPVFTLFQFFFYMGWLKVAEQLINPFGEDDDDFDINWLIDRHTAVAMCLVDQCHGSHPPLIKDVHFNDVATELPYTEASLSSKKPVYLGSTFNLARPPPHEQVVIPPELLAEHPGIRRRHYNSYQPQSLAGSLWSLFSWKQHKGMPMTDSRETMHSTVANGQAGFHMPAHVSYSLDVPVRRKSAEMPEPDELPPEYIPLRRVRASTDVDQRPAKRLIESERERKWSFPLNLLRKKYGGIKDDNTSHSATSSVTSLTETVPLIPPQPKPRFLVETVPDEGEIDASKRMRNKQLIDKMLVSRPTMLSAIEEGNTIRSLKDMMTSGESSPPSPLDVFEETDSIASEPPLFPEPDESTAPQLSELPACTDSTTNEQHHDNVEHSDVHHVTRAFPDTIVDVPDIRLNDDPLSEYP